MRWIGLTYSLPAGPSSSPRVAVWRRQKQLGAVSPTASLCLLPESDENLEALEWLAEEIRGAGGEALVLRIDRLEGEAEGRLIELSRTARAEDYRGLATEAEDAAAQLEKSAAGRSTSGRGDRSHPREPLERLRRRFAEVERIDFFRAPESALAAAALARLDAALAPEAKAASALSRAEPARYLGRPWVTRPRPLVDRLASVWLIRRFIDPEAEIRYRDEPRKGEVSFDMSGAEFGHRGSRCTFETLLDSFGLGGDPALAALAEIVHEIDLRDGKHSRPEIAGVDAALRGWAASGWPDAELERHGAALFEGLYQGLQSPAATVGGPQPERRRKPRGGTSRRKIATRNQRLDP